MWAEKAPVRSQDKLKKRGSRWTPGDNRRPKAGYVDIDAAKRARVFAAGDLSSRRGHADAYPRWIDFQFDLRRVSGNDYAAQKQI